MSILEARCLADLDSVRDGASCHGRVNAVIKISILLNHWI